MASEDPLAPRGWYFLRRRFHDEPEEMEMQAVAAEPVRPPPTTPKQVYWRYGKQCVRESNKTKSELAAFEAFQEADHISESASSVSLAATNSNVSLASPVGSAVDVSSPGLSPRGPRTERAHSTATELGRLDATRDDEPADHASAPSSPRSPGAFFRRLFSGRKKETHSRAMADCME